MGCHKKVGEVGCVDLAGDLCVVASGACVFEDGAVVEGVNPDEFERSVAEIGVGGAKVGDGDVGLGEEGKASEVEGIGGVVGTADCDDGAEVKRRGREHIVVWGGWGACSAEGADVDDGALEGPA